MPTTRRRFSRELKINVVQAYEAGRSVAEITRQYDIHANLVYKWTQEHRNNPTGAFRGSSTEEASSSVSEQRLAELERMVGRLTVENDLLKKALQHAKNILASDKNGGTKP